MRFKTLIIPLLLSMAVITAADGVKINRAAPEVEHKRFDRNSPPSDMPTLEPGEAAVTRSIFGIVSEAEVRSVSEEDGGGKRTVKSKITAITLNLSLKNTIWLPNDAPKTIVDHEEGHRQISESFYKDAERIAREIAQKYIGQALDGESSEKAMNEMSQKYMAQTQSLSVRANIIFDELTDHSRNQKISVERAIKQSIERAKKEKEKK
jgi:hypothetical protein